MYAFAPSPRALPRRALRDSENASRSFLSSRLAAWQEELPPPRRALLRRSLPVRPPPRRGDSTVLVLASPLDHTLVYGYHTARYGRRRCCHRSRFLRARSDEGVARAGRQGRWARARLGRRRTLAVRE